MRLVPVLLLVAAGGVCAWIAFRAPEPDYVPPSAPGAVQAAASVPSALPEEVPEGMAVRTLDVEGMCCNGCTAKLHAALVALPDVSAAAVSFETGRAQALVPADADPAELVDALCFDKYAARLRP